MTCSNIVSAQQAWVTARKTSICASHSALAKATSTTALLYCTSFLGYCQQQKDTQLVGLAYFSEAMLLHWHWVDTLTGHRNSFQHMIESPSVFKNRPANHMTGTCNMLSTKEFAAQDMNKKFITTVCAVAQWGLLRFPADFVRAPVGQKENQTPFPWDHHCRSVSS